jgi:nucleotidyltransferase/DNA polymerase involved in DNA repair
MRVACLLAPHLPVQVHRGLSRTVGRPHNPTLDEIPLVVGGRPWDPGAVLDCCPQAAAASVSPGMRLSQAETLCPAARFVPAQEERYRAAHDALAGAARGFTSTVETAGLGLLYADVSGLERSFDAAQDRRFGPDSHLARQMAREAGHSSGLDVRVGIGSGRFVAEQAARAARPGGGCAVPPGEERVFLSPLPLSVLPADPEMLRRLHLLGVRSLGALAALPRLAVVRQFGPHAGPLYDLARGVDPRAVRADAPPLALERVHTFDDPLAGRAPLLAHAGRMAAALAAELSRRGYQAEGLRLQLEEESGEEHATGARVKPPSADAGKLSRLVARLLGELSPAGPVAVLSLAIYPLRPFHLGATQLALFTGASDSRGERLREALRRLRERFGEMIVVVASLLGPPPPRPIHVTTGPDGLPRALVWRDRIHEVETVYEVWRERRRWWSRPVERDYFRLETADGQVRVVFRDLGRGAGAARWLLERRHI